MAKCAQPFCGGFLHSYKYTVFLKGVTTISFLKELHITTLCKKKKKAEMGGGFNKHG
jgi:hypothetical protein